ncbi:MAG: N-acetylmuramoyl-L-alanine amidase [Deltaproteobacteria bacterium]|nr:N-acetylmuramoyl-L-alanine amidase [Deltaproteobacteria bacterium]
MARLLSLLVVLCIVVPAAAADAAAHLTRVRHLSGLNYTRVILDVTRPVKYSVHTLAPAPAKGLPPRIYLDISGARLTMRRPRININDRLVRRVRVNQFKPGVVRVVLDLKHPGTHDAVLMANPHRIVVDVERRRGAAARRHLAVRKIVLDPGHGGKDPGAVGSGGLREKDVVLRVGRNLAPRLRQEMGVDVVLTRTRDVFVPLKERTAIANREKADLFLSIHSNASRNRRAGGLETYYLDKTTDEATLKLAARENRTARRNLTDLQIMLSDLKLNVYLPDSISLASHLQSSLVKNTRPRYSRAKDLGVKKGLFYVLVGARMPAALAELFFVSNRREARELQRPAMRKALVDGLSRGIKNYADGLRKRENP